MPGKIAYVNVNVNGSQLSRAVEFYRDTLGLTLGFSDEDHGYASFSAGPISLGLAVVGEDQKELVGRHTGVGFNTADLEAEHKRLAELGVVFSMEPSAHTRTLCQKTAWVSYSPPPKKNPAYTSCPPRAKFT